ncbi:MAG: dockerin type I repeat-containing protein, partial [Oscillospiraceae bacterium]|nr:dockerin type I repeat-containing protein [Oscillospiraceae bacterium]
DGHTSTSYLFNGTLYGYSNSTIQEYAEKYNRNFKTLDEIPVYEKGNILKNGSVGVADTICLQKYLHGKQKLTQEQAQLADMNDDGIVNVYDLILLKRKLIYG